MRSIRGRAVGAGVRVSVVVATLIAGLTVLPATSAQAASASPANYSIDCAALAPAGATITGAVGDTFTITNTSATACPLSGESGIVSGMSAIGPNRSESYTIVGGGTFALTTWTGATNGSASVTVTIGAASVHTPGVGEPRAIDLPGNPTVASAVGKRGGIDVSWSAPQWSGEGTITMYAVFATDQASDTALCVAQAPATSCTITSIPAGEMHTFYVKAFSPIGWGTASPASNAAAALPSAIAAPTEVIPVNQGVFVIVRVAGNPEAGATKQYQVANCNRPCANPAVDAGAWSDGDRVQDIDGDAVFRTRDKSKLWAFRGRFVASDGTSSDWKYGVEVVDTKVDAPVTVKASAPRRGKGTDLTWDPTPENAPMITNYEIEYQTRIGKTDTAAYVDWESFGFTNGTLVRLPVVGSQPDKPVYVRMRVRAYAPVSVNLGTPAIAASTWSESNWILETPYVVPTPDSATATVAKDMKSMTVLIKAPSASVEGADSITSYTVRLISGSQTSTVSIFEKSISVKDVTDAGAAGVKVDLSSVAVPKGTELSLRIQSVDGDRVSAWMGGSVS